MRHVDENWVVLVVVTVSIITFGILAYRYNEQQYQIEMHKTTQQAKIDAQSREISRLEQTSKALANQANESDTGRKKSPAD